MPNEDDGYVTRGKGRHSQDTKVASRYRKLMCEDVTEFDETIQQALIDEAQIAARHQGFRAHYMATEPTHVHLLVSWQGERPFAKLRSGIRQSLSRRLSRDFGKLEWLTEGGSRRKVGTQEHFDCLTCTYLPRHSGWKWCEERGLHK